MVLTNRQKKALHGSILQYLLAEGFESAAAEFGRCAGVTAEESEKEAGMLEKKWTSVLRLQKKVMDLEQTVLQLQEDLKGAGSGGKRKAGSNANAVPRPPQKHTLKGHRAAVTGVAVHPTYTQVASCSEDATVKLWDYESGEFERTLKGHTDVVQCVAFHPQGSLLASCSADLTVKLWETEGYNCIKTLKGHEHNVSCVRFLPPSSGKDQLVSSSRDKSIKVWDTNTGYCVRTLSGHDAWVRRVIAHEDGELLASCSNDKTIRLWRLDSGTQQAVLRGHAHVVEDIAFSTRPPADEKRRAVVAKPLLVSASRDKTVMVWDVSTEQLIHTFTEHENWVRGVVFHPTGRYVISVSDDKCLMVFDLEQNRLVKKISPAHDHFISNVVINPRDLVVVTASVDQTLRVWESS
mmetsp:Transcript_21985/g.61807  ORF Transcript_21985/g.61807 Transcript_21985/m.61807 type:complete len:407 (+) Transcript_21985:156-1376(+)|eukprot:CAMPEP_0119128492 /NCGR_PEP_ID=MMETSP1310-20130426/6627_1 /TAXON_ID=464262 /ORGANISM="Genus nov. species nov., Strain RCC2339" /LENGTH=406 /DNA_ID=CAMNT_0007118837 /DNA_START=111 /DNA_END=1331 /DNA_ORIENTATION=-